MSDSREYEDECRMARRIALQSSRWETVEAIAEAIATSPEHGILLDGDSVIMTYLNEFGPTCAVDDAFEQITMRDWRSVFVSALSFVLYGEPHGVLNRGIHPSVTFTPEKDTDIINRVTVSAHVPKTLYSRVLAAVDARDAKGVKPCRD